MAANTGGSQNTQGWAVVSTPGKLPVVNTIFDFSADALAEFRLWLEQNPPAIPITSVLGFKQQQDIRGRVSSAGAIVSGSGFTVTHIGTGEYEIDFTTVLSSVPAISITIDSNLGASLCAVVANASTSLFQVNTFTPSTGAKTDAGFYFLAAPFT